ncbi:response regulator [Dongia sp.]|uniref:response regulator n=1 Tax=Dongia sp. TaxID=1977262 RepID=UPI0035AE8D6E
MTEKLKRILIVDDDEGFLAFARDAALTKGWAVETAANGIEGCDAFIRFRPDIVLLDIVMPKMDGFEVLHWLAEQHTDCRIIVLTGYNPSYAAMAEQLGGANGLMQVTMMTKPVRLAALVAAMAE